jgi:hypothetical protein
MRAFYSHDCGGLGRSALTRRCEISFLTASAIPSLRSLNQRRIIFSLPHPPFADRRPTGPSSSTPRFYSPGPLSPEPLPPLLHHAPSFLAPPPRPIVFVGAMSRASNALSTMPPSLTPDSRLSYWPIRGIEQLAISPEKHANAG